MAKYKPIDMVKFYQGKNPREPVGRLRRGSDLRRRDHGRFLLFHSITNSHKNVS